MLKITLINLRDVYLSKSAVKEICPTDNPEVMKVYTDNNEYLIRKTEVQKILEYTDDNQISYLAQVINNLTQLLRARMR